MKTKQVTITHHTKIIDFFKADLSLQRLTVHIPEDKGPDYWMTFYRSQFKGLGE